MNLHFKKEGSIDQKLRMLNIKIKCLSGWPMLVLLWQSDPLLRCQGHADFAMCDSLCTCWTSFCFCLFIFEILNLFNVLCSDSCAENQASLEQHLSSLRACLLSYTLQFGSNKTLLLHSYYRSFTNYFDTSRGPPPPGHPESVSGSSRRGSEWIWLVSMRMWVHSVG